MRNFLMTTVAAIGIATIAASAPAAQGGHGNNAAGGHGHSGLAHGAPGRSGPVHALADPVTADQPAASGLALDPAATNYAGDTPAAPGRSLDPRQRPPGVAVPMGTPTASSHSAKLLDTERRAGAEFDYTPSRTVKCVTQDPPDSQAGFEPSVKRPNRVHQLNRTPRARLTRLDPRNRPNRLHGSQF